MRRTLVLLTVGLLLLIGAPAVHAGTNNLVRISRPHFGRVAVGTTAREVVRVTNVWSADIEIASISMEEPDPGFEPGLGARSTCNPTPVTLGPSETCGVVIKFTPSEPGVFRVINFTVTMIIDGQTYQEQISFKALAVGS
jgi:hypothetical protein